MPNPAQSDAISQPNPVRPGEVISHVMTELNMLCGELAALRVLRDDLALWFKLHPDRSEQFGEFQYQRNQQRAKQRTLESTNVKRRTRKR